MPIDTKIKQCDELLTIISQLKAEGKKIVQSHGIFDIIHPGIIRHIESAKNQGDVLIVTVVKDQDVLKGPGYPIFSEKLRAENVASLEYVDYVAIVEDTVPFECVKVLKPDIFAKGQDYDKRDQEVLRKLKSEEETIGKAGCTIYHTPGERFSSTSIINQIFEVYPEETREFLKRFKEGNDAAEIMRLIKSLSDLKVLVIGDAIIDEYHYCESLGKSIKDNLVVNRYLHEERFAGGTIAVANHLAGICNNVQLVTLLGQKDSKVDFILSKLKPNIIYKFFYNEDAPTIVKRRFIDHYLNQKLFEVCYMDRVNINEKLEDDIFEYLNLQIPQYELILIADFGHGLITERLIKLLEEKSNILAVNVQTNGANVGYNMITKYSKIQYACIDESEARLACQDRYRDIDEIVKRIVKHLHSDHLIVTRGKYGSVGLFNETEFVRTPAFATRVVDRIGAGDAFFAFTAPCFARKFKPELISFIGNAVAALAVQVVCNRNPVEPAKLCAFISTLLR